MKIVYGLKSVGPAIVVAAVVLGPGSILTSSKVGSQFGFAALPILALAVVLMIAMVALSGRLGVTYEHSLCEELAQRLGRWVAIAVGGILFVLVALFQSSNNIAVVAGIEPLLETGDGEATFLSSPFSRGAILAVVNLFVLLCLYRMRHLYGVVERLMKVLVLLMVLAFFFNFLVVLLRGAGYQPSAATGKRDLIPLIGMIGTTFSIGGAFYQGYLVREKGWTVGNVKQNLADSFLGISILGGVTAVILMTSTLVFYGRAEPVVLSSVGDVARQLEPLFGPSAKVIFCVGIFAGAFSSFLVNAMIGGTVLADSLGLGSRMDDRWTRHLTALALLIGMGVAILSLAGAKGTVGLITFAQALTVLGLPALALALLYLGTRPELSGEKKIPRWILGLGCAGLLVACVLAVRTAAIVYGKIAGA